MERHRERVQRFEQLLSSFVGSSPSSGGASAAPPPAQPKEHYELSAAAQEQLRSLARQGIPDDPSHLRPRVYRALLSLSPSSSLTEQYSSFLSEITSRIEALPPPAPGAPEQRYDRLLREIERDVGRTFGALAWFGGAANTGEGARDALWTRLDKLDEADRRQARELAESEAKKAEKAAGSNVVASPPSPPSTTAPSGTPSPTIADSSASSSDATAVSSAPSSTSSSPISLTRRQALLRPLFVYAFLNPGLSYVQGMSYLAAVLFYVFSPSPDSSTSPSPALDAEASTFFALGALLSQLRDLYTPTLDGTSSPRLFPNTHGRTGSASTLPTGLSATVARFNGLLMAMDPNVADALERKDVEMGGLLIRWTTTAFANEFTLPDVVRIWDRLLSLYPPESEHAPAEALSPVLGHLLDLGIAIILLERSKIVSPFSRLPEILTLLQNPSTEVDRLLQTAWDVRERRLGRNNHNKRNSVQSDAGASPAKSVFGLGKKLWSGGGGSPAPTTPTRPAVHVAPSEASEFELDERSSAAGSDFTRPRFGSLAFSSPRSSQDLTGNVTVIDGKVLPPPPARIDEQATIASLIEEELAADRALQTPGADDYGLEDDEDEDGQKSTLAQRAASGWGGLKSSFSRFASSDTAANLQKRATNLQLAAASASSNASSRFHSSDAAAALFKAQTNAAAKAQLLREQLAQEGPEKLAQIKEAASGAQERFLGSTGSERGDNLRRGGPRETPFTPPGAANRNLSPSSSPRLGSNDMGRSGSNGPKPLLLSSSARRAEGRSEDSPLDSPHARRSSTNFGRSPSASPVAIRTPLLSPDLSIPPLSRSPSAHGRSASHFDTPLRANSSNPASASSFRPRSSSVAQVSSLQMQDDDSPIASIRIRDPSTSLRRGGPPSSRRTADGSPVPTSARPADGGRGWQLSDAPVRPASSTSSRSSEKQASAKSDPHRLPEMELPPLDLGFDPSAVSESVEPLQTSVQGMSLTEGAEVISRGSLPVEREEPFEPPFSSPPLETPSSAPSELPFAPPSETPFSPPTLDEQQPLPPRRSSLANSTSSLNTANSLPSLRTTSLASFEPIPSLSSSTSSSVLPSSTEAETDTTDDAPLSAAPSLSRSKLVRRPPAQRKRTSRSSISTASVDLTGAEARRVASEFLTRSASRGGGGSASAESSASEGGAGSRRSLHRKRASEVNLNGAGGAARLSRADFDEDSFLDAYGGEEGELGSAPTSCRE
ncbi:hypothetical protein JCM8547_005445 [Rhodosporidiobolus lusitaniae]